MFQPHWAFMVEGPLASASGPSFLSEDPAEGERHPTPGQTHAKQARRVTFPLRTLPAHGIIEAGRRPWTNFPGRLGAKARG